MDLQSRSQIAGEIKNFENLKDFALENFIDWSQGHKDTFDSKIYEGPSKNSVSIWYQDPSPLPLCYYVVETWLGCNNLSVQFEAFHSQRILRTESIRLIVRSMRSSVKFLTFKSFLLSILEIWKDFSEKRVRLKQPNIAHEKRLCSAVSKSKTIGDVNVHKFQKKSRQFPRTFRRAAHSACPSSFVASILPLFHCRPFYDAPMRFPHRLSASTTVDGKSAAGPISWASPDDHWLPTPDWPHSPPTRRPASPCLSSASPAVAVPFLATRSPGTSVGISRSTTSCPP